MHFDIIVACAWFFLGCKVKKMSDGDGPWADALIYEMLVWAFTKSLYFALTCNCHWSTVTKCIYSSTVICKYIYKILVLGYDHVVVLYT